MGNFFFRAQGEKVSSYYTLSTEVEGEYRLVFCNFSRMVSDSSKMEIATGIYYKNEISVPCKANQCVLRARAP